MGIAFLGRFARVTRMLALAAVSGIVMQASAWAHPHVWVTARTELVFNGPVLESVRHVWQFDVAFTSFAIQGLDLDEDGKLSKEELQPLAKVNVESLKEFDFFTFVEGGDFEAEFIDPKEYWLDFNNGLLTLFYTLPLKTPVGPGPKGMVVEVYDPSFFVAFEMVKEDPVIVSNLPDSCKMVFAKPEELQSDVAAALAQIPSSVKDLPQEFMNVTETRANTATITCQ